MYYRYQPYPYYRRHYNISPYHYRRYYNPYYNFINSQIASVDQNMTNFGNMTNVSQDSNIYQLRSSASEPESVGICTAPTAEEPTP